MFLLKLANREELTCIADDDILQVVRGRHRHRIPNPETSPPGIGRHEKATNNEIENRELSESKRDRIGHRENLTRPPPSVCSNIRGSFAVAESDRSEKRVWIPSSTSTSRSGSYLPSSPFIFPTIKSLPSASFFGGSRSVPSRIVNAQYVNQTGHSAQVGSALLSWPPRRDGTQRFSGRDGSPRRLTAAERIVAALLLFSRLAVVLLLKIGTVICTLRELS
ncbi:hypothetical protein BHM03_00033609 [Ensete ventricosum]|nr:hypothetical protein BHM03_00033609 [Ensete ventricosum]